MKKILSILAIITIIGTSTTSLVACNIVQEYTPEELKELKEKNKINTANKEIRNNLEWMAPQEKPFNNVDDRWYFVIWKNDNWKIDKIFRDYDIEVGKEYLIYKNNNYELKFFRPLTRTNKIGDASLFYNRENPFVFRKWGEKNSDYINYIKSVYRWNLDTTAPDLIIDDNGNVKVKGE